jgi:signal transduction histidine kinase
VRVESARPQFDVQHERLVRIPLTYQHATVGALLLAPRRGDAFSPADRRLLHDLARQAGVAVHAVRLHAYAVQLSTDLQQSRERMVTAREEERRRLRRDLHDGLGPTLAGLTLKVDAALDELAYDTASTAALLHELKGDIQTAITDIRRLVYALRPPALDELSLVGALRVQLASFEHAGLQIVLEALGDLRTLPAAVEVAAYRIVLEAVTNVARHAHAAHAWIHLSRTETHVIIDIQDDGRGVSHNLVPGVGLQSMRERAAELGGTCAITSRSAGGIHVVARLPTHKE